MSSAPDYIEPIVGWRTWLVVQQGGRFRLRSVVYDALWPPRKELFARCLGRSPSALFFPWRRRSEHDPPARRCGCGIYATREPEDAAYYLDVRSWGEAPGVLRVIGTVSLWGQVVECTDGWRAAYAYPKTIHVPTLRARRTQTEQAQEIALALTDYGVPVDLLDADAHLPADVVAGLGLAAAHSCS